MLIIESLMTRGRKIFLMQRHNSPGTISGGGEGSARVLLNFLAVEKIAKERVHFDVRDVYLKRHPFFGRGVYLPCPLRRKKP